MICLCAFLFDSLGHVWLLKVFQGGDGNTSYRKGTMVTTTVDNPLQRELYAAATTVAQVRQRSWQPYGALSRMAPPFIGPVRSRVGHSAMPVGTAVTDV